MLQTTVATLLVLLAAGVMPSPDAPAILQPKAVNGEDPEYRLLLGAVSVWLAQELRMPVIRTLPRVRIVPPAELLAVRRAGDRPHHADPQEVHDIVALYEDSTRTIHLEHGWNPATVAGQSLLVHEMVHHVQALTGQRFACAGERERAAYAAQARWLELHGLSLESEFAIDPLTRLVRTSCGM